MGCFWTLAVLCRPLVVSREVWHVYRSPFWASCFRAAMVVGGWHRTPWDRWVTPVLRC